MDNNPQPKKTPQPTPQPQPQPMQPQQPAPNPQPVPTPATGQPQPMQPGMQYNMPPKKPRSKGLIWGIVGGVIALVAIVVGVVLLLTVFNGNAKEDYRHTYDFMRTYSIDSSALELTASMSSAKLDEWTGKFDEYINKLGQEKSMRDADLKKAYDEYKAEWEKSKTTLKSAAQAQDAFNKIQEACDFSEYVSYLNATPEEFSREFDDTYSGCMKALEESKSSSTKTVADYASAQLEYLKKLKEYGMKMAERAASGSSSSADEPERPTPQVDEMFGSLDNTESPDYTKLSEAEARFMSVLMDKLK